VVICREPVGKEERAAKLGAIQATAFDAVRAMDKYTGVDDATVSTTSGVDGAAVLPCTILNFPAWIKVSVAPQQILWH
jgi:hypothetical protein